MILAEVVGRVWCDRQLDGLAARRMVIVRDLSDRTTRVAVDMLDAGLGTTVLVTTDEAAAAACGEAIADAAIVALVSDYDSIPKK
jgi:ethanolamine utilization protein EutN